MPLIETTGAASSRGFGQFARSAAAVYIEDVFQTWLYTGNGSTQTITNGIDLAGKGGLVFTKCRSTGGVTYIPAWVSNDTGLSSFLDSSSTSALGGVAAFGFNSNGFTINTSNSRWNGNADTYASWTFRKQPKFFDVVTYTGNGSGSGQVINHNLASVPGCIIAKRTNSTGDWYVLHRSVGSSGGSNAYGVLNSTAAWVNPGLAWAGAAPTSTQFSVESNLNINGATYVAYLFAHDAGGFGASGTDNVISCGSYTDNGTDQVISLGYEPQWILVKDSASSANWFLIDTMRGWLGQPVSATASCLFPNTSGAEIANGEWLNVTPTGFQIKSGSGLGNSTYIYIAIRRGPMRTPTTGTSVFAPNAYTGNGSSLTQTTGFVTDLVINSKRDSLSAKSFVDRLRGRALSLNSTRTDAEATSSSTQDVTGFDRNTGYLLGTPFNTNFNANASDVDYAFRRAPGFFDVVCYTGNGSASQLATHNLGVAPELYICKRRDSTSSWEVWSKTTGVDAVYSLALQSTGAGLVNAAYNGYATSTTIEVGGQVASNTNGATYVAYLFASCPGVSKVGRYTGTGTTLQVNCGFTGGARFVLIKRTDSTGDWYVWDSARGIVAGNDPYLLLNSTAAEVTSTDYVDTFSSGFEISSTAPAAINANGGTFIFLAIS